MIEQDNFGRNLPTAMVQYYSIDTARQAVSVFNGKRVMNSVLTVEPYRRNLWFLFEVIRCQSINQVHNKDISIIIYFMFFI